MQERTFLIRPAMVCKQLGISNTTLWRLIRDKKLNAPIKISSRCTAFKTKDIENYINSIMEVRNDNH